MASNEQEWMASPLMVTLAAPITKQLLVFELPLTMICRLALLFEMGPVLALAPGWL